MDNLVNVILFNEIVLNYCGKQYCVVRYSSLADRTSSAVAKLVLTEAILLIALKTMRNINIEISCFYNNFTCYPESYLLQSRDVNALFRSIDWKVT